MSLSVGGDEVSYTGYYSPFYLLSENKRIGINVKDPEQILALLKTIFGDNSEQLIVTEPVKETSKSQIFVIKHLLIGLSQNKHEEFCRPFYIERFGFEYNEKEFIKFFSVLSKHTEPFYFYHSSKLIDALDVADEPEDTDNFRVYKVVCDNGTVQVDPMRVIVEGALRPKKKR